MNLFAYIILLIILMIYPINFGCDSSYYFFIKYLTLNKEEIKKTTSILELQQKIYVLQNELKYVNNILASRPQYIKNNSINEVDDKCETENQSNKNIQKLNINNQHNAIINQNNTENALLNQDNNQNNYEKSIINNLVFPGILVYAERFFEDNIVYLYTNFLDKVKLNDLIIYDQQLIGVISKIEKNFAIVKLLSNKDSNVPVINVRTQDRYLVSGDNKARLGLNKLQIKYIDKQNAPQKGDILILDYHYNIYQNLNKDIANVDYKEASNLQNIQVDNKNVNDNMKYTNDLQLNFNYFPIFVGTIIDTKQNIVLAKQINPNKARYILILPKN